jgi:soluble epoxide hydrolase/lipid-phosphate phosphatase
MKEYVSDLKVVGVDCGHWVQIEKKDEVNTALEEFFTSFEEEK